MPCLSSTLVPAPDSARVNPAFDDAPCHPCALPSPNGLESFWMETGGEMPGGHDGGRVKLEGDAGEADVVIIGSGITGVSAAYHLVRKLAETEVPLDRYTKSKPRIVVLEARGFCMGATGRNGGHLTPLSSLSWLDVLHKPHLLRHEWPSTSANADDHVHPSPVVVDEHALRVAQAKRVFALERRTESTLRRLAESDGEQGASVDLVSGGNLHLCQREEEEVAYANSREAAKRDGLEDGEGGKVEFWDRNKVNEALSNPTPLLRSAYRIPGSNVHPPKLVRLLWQEACTQASKAGIALELFIHSPVLDVSSSSSAAPFPRLGDKNAQEDRWKVRTPDGRLHTRYVLHATNAYLSHLAPHLSGPRGVVPTRGQCIAALPRAKRSADGACEEKEEGEQQDGGHPWKGWRGGCGANEGFEYLFVRTRPSPSSSSSSAPLILGGLREVAHCPNPRPYEWGISDDSTLRTVISRALRKWLVDRFPDSFVGLDDASEREGSLAGCARVVKEWTGVMGFTKDRDPLVGPLPSSARDASAPLKGQYVAAGYSGHGMTRAFSCAEAVAEMILADMSGKAFQVPDWFPTSYLTYHPRSSVFSPSLLRSSHSEEETVDDEVEEEGRTVHLRLALRANSDASTASADSQATMVEKGLRSTVKLDELSQGIDEGVGSGGTQLRLKLKRG